MTVRRLASLTAAYAAASFVAACIVVVAFIVFSPGPLILEPGLAHIAVQMTAFVACLIAALALLPSLAAIAYAQRHGIRAPAWYAAAGLGAGLAAAAIYVAILLLRAGADRSIPTERGFLAGLAGIVAVIAVAGMGAGLTFWLIAGRSVTHRTQAEQRR